MKHHHISTLRLAALAGSSLVTPAFAVVNIDYVTVGNAGNAANFTQGAVAYIYKISKYETTISQYAEFLNAKAQTDTYGLYDTRMASDYNIQGITQSGGSGSHTYSVMAGSGNHPITNLSWFDAARFTNWMSNGQGSGSTETGSYNLSGATSGIILKNVGATVWIPSADEWYKAAFYDPNKGGVGIGGYWQQATQSNTLSGNTIGIADSANYYDGDFAVTHSGTYVFSQNYLTDVGAYGAASESYYGTSDQAGSVSEWNDAVITATARGLRGGSWGGDGGMSASTGTNGRTASDNGDEYLGFRLASVPEPSSFVLTLLTSGALLLRRKRM